MNFSQSAFALFAIGIFGCNAITTDTTDTTDFTDTETPVDKDPTNQEIGKALGFLMNVGYLIGFWYYLKYRDNYLKEEAKLSFEERKKRQEKSKAKAKK